MTSYIFSQLTEETLKKLVTLNEKYAPPNKWDKMQVELTVEESRRLNDIKSTLHQRHLLTMNEATIWSRAIYPLLVLAEREYIQAWSNVPLNATFPTFQLEGEADGALAPALGGHIRPPYLIVHEAKRGIQAPEPQFQLYGEMLAAAWLSWKKNNDSLAASECSTEQEIFGCYTVNDSWAFVHGVVSDIETEKPTFTIDFSPVYNGFWDAEHIVQLLKFIVAKHLKEINNG